MVERRIAAGAVQVMQGEAVDIRTEIFGERVHVVRVDRSEPGWVWVLGADQGWRRLTPWEWSESQCLDMDESCAGEVRLRRSLSGSGARIPRCDKHWQEGLCSAMR